MWSNMAEAYPSPEFRCLLCEKIHENPRELPCGHTFCCPCLTTYIQAEHVCANEDRHYFPCPVCDSPITPRDPNIHVNTCGTSFPMKDSQQRIPTISPPTDEFMNVWECTVSCVKTLKRTTIGGPNIVSLTSGLFTDEGQLLITDNNNKRLLLFDDNYSFLKEYNVDGRPLDVTRGRVADEIFMSLDWEAVLKCTLRNGQLSVTDRISCPRGVSGIAVHGDNIFTCTPENIEVLSMEGQLIRSIAKGGTDNYLALSTSKARLYHKDENDIVCRRLDNDEIIYRYTDPGLIYPIGIGLDRDDNLYVCGCTTRNVYLVSPDGSRGKALLTKLANSYRPFAIIVHPTKQEFIVTSVRESVLFEVYRFNNNA